MTTVGDTKLQQISASVAALVAAVPPLVQGDMATAAIGLLGVGIASVIENVRARTNALDDQVRDAFADARLRERFDDTVKPDEFIALYVRARDTAAKSEKEQKLRYIRNFLVNAVTVPTSSDPDKERYLRLVDDLSFRELEYLIGFLRMVVPSAGSATLEEWVKKPQRTGGSISTYASHLVGGPNANDAAKQNEMTDELVVSFRHLYSAGLLNGIAHPATRDFYHFETNGFTPKFLRFVLDPF